MDVIEEKSILAASRPITRATPINWGKTELTHFLALAEEQMFASYVGLPKWISALELVDRSLTENAPTYFHEIDLPRQISASLFLRSLGTFRATCRLALSGQMFEANVLTRSILESGVYAWACAHSQDHRDAWNSRGNGDTEKATARRRFKWGTLIGLLREADADLADRVNTLYDITIDYGAHPNVDGVTLSTSIKNTGGDRFQVSTIFLHGQDEVLLSVLTLLRAMEMIYRLLDLTIHDRLQILGIDRQFDEQRHLLLKLLGDLQIE